MPVPPRPLDSQPPLFARKPYDAPSIFTVASLLQAARAQKHLADDPVPPICVLDPDGDLVDYARAALHATPHPAWACYHTQLDLLTLPDQNDQPIGVIGRAVGAPFATLVAEELFASGCQLLISVTSAGQIVPLGQPPYFVLIERAWRDEGTSYHYLPPAPFSMLAPALLTALQTGWRSHIQPLYIGGSWTTDAPFRETAAQVAAAHARELVAVEMEAAALYALAMAQRRDIICFAHITNQLGQGDADFEKGHANGSLATLAVIQEATRIWRAQTPASLAPLPDA